MKFDGVKNQHVGTVMFMWPCLYRLKVPQWGKLAHQGMQHKHYCPQLAFDMPISPCNSNDLGLLWTVTAIIILLEHTDWTK